MPSRLLEHRFQAGGRRAPRGPGQTEQSQGHDVEGGGQPPGEVVTARPIIDESRAERAHPAVERTRRHRGWTGGGAGVPAFSGSLERTVSRMGARDPDGSALVTRTRLESRATASRMR